jgi:hypothetical protein
VTASTTLSNSMPQARRYAFHLDSGSELQVTPSSGVVAGNSSVRLQVDYAPRSSQTVHDQDEQPRQKAEPADPALQKEASIPDTEDRTEKSGQHGPDWKNAEEWHLTCYHNHFSKSMDVAQVLDSLALEIHTCAVLPCLCLDGTKFIRSRNRHVLDFGTVCTGKRETKEVQLSTTLAHDTTISFIAPHPLGPFEQATACRVLPAGGSVPFKIAFFPTAEGTFWEVVEFHANGLIVCCDLRGEAKLSCLCLTEPQQPHLDFGCVNCSSQACLEQDLQITNPCPFPLKCRPRCALPVPGNVGNIQPSLYFHPCCVTLEPGQEATVKARYKPDWEVCLICDRHRFAGLRLLELQMPCRDQT